MFDIFASQSLEFIEHLTEMVKAPGAKYLVVFGLICTKSFTSLKRGGESN
jgi:hypothetical protein